MFNTKEEIAKAFAEIAFPLHECMTKASTEIYHNPDKRIINTPELRTRYFKRVLAEYLSMEFTGEIQTDLAKGKQGRPTLVHVPSGAWIPFRAAQGLRRNESSARRAVTSALFGRGQLDDLRGSKAKAEYDPAFPFGALAFEYPPVDEEGHPVVPWQLAFVKCYPSSTLESGRFQYRLPIRANDDFSTMSRGFKGSRKTSTSWLKRLQVLEMIRLEPQSTIKAIADQKANDTEAICVASGSDIVAYFAGRAWR